MRQLSGLDTSFLSMETPSQYGHVASLTVYDLSGWNQPASFFETISTLVQQRIHLLPLLRRRLVEVPFGLDHPYWIDDSDFDLEFHVRNLALPNPGSDQQLAEQVARLTARALDRSRPLWELYVIEGLANQRVAMFTKIHHAAIDGMQGVEVLTTLLDTDSGGRDIESPTRSWSGEAVPSNAALLTRTALTLSRNPFRAARLTARAARSAVGLARASGLRRLPTLPCSSTLGQVPVVGTIARMLSDRDASEHFPVLAQRPAPRTPFNRAITPHRRYAFRTMSLEDTKLVKNTFGGTVNDVVLAVCAGAMRRYLHDQRALPGDPLTAMVPVSVRSGREEDPYSNQVAAMLTSLHTDIVDPVDRLRAIHRSTAAAKEMTKAVPADLLTDLAHFAPPAVFARASRLATRTGVINRIAPPFNLVISNVPGPAVPLYCGGAPLLHYYPVSTIVEGQGINITVQSYLGNLDFGVITCRELVPDAWMITRLLGESFDELVAAARNLESQKAPAAPARRSRPSTSRRTPAKRAAAAQSR